VAEINRARDNALRLNKQRRQGAAACGMELRPLSRAIRANKQYSIADLQHTSSERHCARREKEEPRDPTSRKPCRTYESLLAFPMDARLSAGSPRQTPAFHPAFQRLARETIFVYPASVSCVISSPPHVVRDKPKRDVASRSQQERSREEPPSELISSFLLSREPLSRMK